jgi:hypothetical protein
LPHFPPTKIREEPKFKEEDTILGGANYLPKRIIGAIYRNINGSELNKRFFESNQR